MTHVIDGHQVGTPELAKPARNDREKARLARGDMGLEMTLNSNSAHAAGGWGMGAMGGWEPAATRKIFVGGLSHQTKDQALFEYFSQFGTVTDVVVMTEGSSRRPRGFGFVTFDDPKVVPTVTRTRYHPIGQRLVEVKPAVPREIMSLTQSQDAGMPGSSPPKELSAPTGDASASGPGIMESAPGSPTMQSGHEWYPSGYSAYQQRLYGAGNQMMVGGVPDTTMTTGVPVYNGYAPGYAPQMMVPMGPSQMMVPMASVMGNMSGAMAPSIVAKPIANELGPMASLAPPQMMAPPPTVMPPLPSQQHGMMPSGANMVPGAPVVPPLPPSYGQPAGGGVPFVAPQAPSMTNAPAPMAMTPMGAVPMGPIAMPAGAMPDAGSAMVMAVGAGGGALSPTAWPSNAAMAQSAYISPPPAVPAAVPAEAQAAPAPAESGSA